MILLLGATGYIGQAFAAELRRRGERFIPLSRKAFDYTSFELLFDYVRKIRPRFIINAAGYSGKPNVDACELAHGEAFQANVVLPQTVARVCLVTQTPMGHVSSGCIYSGAKILEKGHLRLEKDLSRPEIRKLFDTHPERFFGFTEEDEPNFSFQNQPCSFLGGTKALAEAELRQSATTYVWRLRLPFSEQDSPANLLSKLLRYPKIYDSVNSLSHVDDFVRACLDLWKMQAAYGIYNITNPGAVATHKVVQMLQRVLKPRRFFEYWIDDDEFYREGARAPRSNCILDVSKLLRAGIKMRPVEDALEASLRKWRPAQATTPSDQALAAQMAGFLTPNHHDWTPSLVCEDSEMRVTGE